MHNFDISRKDKKVTEHYILYQSKFVSFLTVIYNSLLEYSLPFLKATVKYFIEKNNVR